MFTKHKHHRALTLPCLLLAGLGACQDDYQSPVDPDFSVLEHQTAPQSDFRVYTQNVYLGGDTGPLFTLDFSDFPAVIGAANVFWADVQASDPSGRASAFVDQIERSGPNVVALQEVLRFILLDGSFQPTGGIDFLALIEAEISRRGMPYETAVVQEGTTSTLPLSVDPATGGIGQWLNFTDRVVILRHTGTDVVETASGLYAASLPLGPIELVRGWARLTVDHHGTPHHFVATHLETQAIAPIHDAQAAELQNVVIAGLEGITIIAGDLNSDAAAQEGAPSWTPTYGNLIAGGFADVWTGARGHAASGVTCCQAPDLRGPSELDERIDFVLVRSSEPYQDGHELNRRFFQALMVGADEHDRTDSGLWPSDHAGLVGAIRQPRGW
jgi:Endonuclease/Exonuclease/phosphatase family